LRGFNDIFFGEGEKNRWRIGTVLSRFSIPLYLMELAIVHYKYTVSLLALEVVAYSALQKGAQKSEPRYYYPQHHLHYHFPREDEIRKNVNCF